jgi:hypothetical protein
METAITLRGVANDADALISESSLKVKNRLLATAATIEKVSSQEEYEAAATIFKELKTFSSGIENARKVVKAPVLELGKKVDDIAKSFTLSVDSEVKRIERLSQSFLLEEQRKKDAVMAEEKRRQAEILEEARRKEAELQAKLESAKSGVKKEIIQAEIAQMQNTTIANLQESSMAIAEAGAKAEGVGTRKDWIVNVTDIHALYKAYPNLVRMEANVTDLKSLIKLNKGKIEIPGVTFFEKIGLVNR